MFQKTFLQRGGKAPTLFGSSVGSGRFYLALQPLVTRPEDGHTDLEIPMGLYNAGNPFVFPNAVRLSPEALYIGYGTGLSRRAG